MADPKTSLPLTRDSIIATHDTIRSLVHRTPVMTNSTLNDMASRPRAAESLAGTRWEGRRPARPVMRFWFKCENLQRAGAFKIRGASHALARLTQEPGWAEAGGREKGVLTHSSGNHAAALSLAARTLGIPAHIVMPTISAPSKIAATRTYGGQVYFSGSKSDEREAVAAEVAAKTGARLVHPYDHPDIVLGQGTVGIELQEQVAEMRGLNGLSGLSATTPPLDAVVVPSGGGGLLTGTALSCEGTGVRVFSAEPSEGGADDIRRGFAAGKRIEAVESLTVADGLRTPMGLVNWQVCHDLKLVEAVFAVSDADISRALRLVLERMRLVVEPSAVVGLAVALFNEDFRAIVEREAGREGWDIGIIFSGGNLELSLLPKLLALADEEDAKRTSSK